MPATEVLIVFYCRSGGAEKLALAAAVGAVQNRAKIRLRRLGDVEFVIDDKPAAADLIRMRKEYAEPTEADIIRADAIIFVAPAALVLESVEWRPLLDLFARLHTERKLTGKIAAILAETGSAGTLLSEMLLPFDFTPAFADSTDPIETGRQTITLASKPMASP